MKDMIKIDIKSKIFNIRDKQVMLDRDLAELYGVETKNLNRAVNRNIERFPEHFRFRLTKEEFEDLRFQIGTLSLNSENGTWGKHTKYLPYAFTEQGVSMLSAVLRSKIAIEVSIKIIDSFIAMRKIIANNDFFLRQLDKIEKKQILYEAKSNENFEKIFKALENKNHIQEQGIFYNGQIFDAYSFVSDLIRSAKESIILIDNYIDDKTLRILSKNQEAKVAIYTQNITKTLMLDIEKYNKQYKEISLNQTKNFHDRFLIIDKKEIYLIGASLKDLGKKVFGFSKVNDFKNQLINNF